MRGTLYVMYKKYMYHDVRCVGLAGGRWLHVCKQGLLDARQSPWEILFRQLQRVMCVRLEGRGGNAMRQFLLSKYTIVCNSVLHNRCRGKLAVSQ